LFKKGVIVSLILLVCIAITYLFIGSHLFLVEEIEISNSRLVDEESLSRLSQCKGKNIFLIPMGALREKIEENPEVKCTVIRKELPHKLTIEIQKYMPCAFLNQSALRWSWLAGKIKLAVSKEGVVFPFKEVVTESYPLVIYEKENFPVGEQWPNLEEAMKAYLAVKNIVPIEIIKVKRNDEIFLYIKNTKTEIRMNSGEYEKKADYLRILMKELPSKNVKYIDLRFGRDIIVKP